MQAIQLELWPSEGRQPLTASDYNPPMPDGLIGNPCKACGLREFCDRDDCGNKGFDYIPPATRFYNLNDAIEYIRVKFGQ